MLTVLGGLAEFERELIVTRTGEGRARAVARGQHMGRPPMLTAHQRTEALRALADGSATQADLARRFNVSQSTISRLGNKLIPAKAQPPLDSDTERAARVFMSRISGRYAVDRAILFGSRARRTHNATSDADIAVEMKGEHGERSTTAIDMAGIGLDVILETGILVGILTPLGKDSANPDTLSKSHTTRTTQ